MGSPGWRRSLVVLTTLFAVGPHRCRAAEEPYCGLYSIHAALHALAREADFQDMIEAEYLSGTYGSTAADLINLAEKYGATAHYRARMTVGDLRSSACPIVLHTSGVTAQAGFHHWVLFLGMDGNSVKIYDPPHGLYTTSSGELLSYWDGSGVAVNLTDSTQTVPVPSLEIVFAFLLVCVAGAVCFQIPALRAHPAWGTLAVAVVAGVAWNAFVDYGFFWNPKALANVAGRYERVSLPIVSLDQFRKLVGLPDVTIVDARLPNAYQRAHVPGAINVPIDVSHGLLAEGLATIPPNNQIVFYCKSDRCRWADSVATQFAARGYSKVAIFRDGMDAWEGAAVAPADERCE